MDVQRQAKGFLKKKTLCKKKLGTAQPEQKPAKNIDGVWQQDAVH